MTCSKTILQPNCSANRTAYCNVCFDIGEKSIGTRIFLRFKICGTDSRTPSGCIICAFIWTDSRLPRNDSLGGDWRMMCIFCAADTALLEKRHVLHLIVLQTLKVF